MINHTLASDVTALLSKTFHDLKKMHVLKFYFRRTGSDYNKEKTIYLIFLRF